MSIRTPAAGWLAAGFGLVFFLVTTAITWAEHDTYNSTSLDMAVYTQLAWNTAQGHPFETTLLLQNRLHLAEHLALLLLPLAPLYGLLPQVKLLLALQQAALALSGAAVFWLARRRLGPWLALLIVAGYYAMPTLTEVALDAFYPIAFTALPLGWAAALAIGGWRRAAALPAILAVVVEEEAALLAVGIGLYLLFRPAGRRAGATLLLLGALWLGVAEGVVMPHYYQPTTAGDETRAENHFGQLRESPLDWLRSVAVDRLDPDALRAVPAVRRLLRPEACTEAGHCSALRWWLYPTAGLALLSPPTLVMAAPSASALLLADKPGRFRRHWAAPLLPIVWLATAVGLSHLASRRGLALAGAGALVAASLVFYRLDSSLPLGAQYEAGDLVWTPLGSDLSRLGGAIPPDASALASRRGLAHLANRRWLYAFPPGDYGPGLWPPPEPPAYALLDLKNADTVRALDGADSPLRATPRYQEVARTPYALLLSRD